MKLSQRWQMVVLLNESMCKYLVIFFEIPLTKASNFYSDIYVYVYV